MQLKPTTAGLRFTLVAALACLTTLALGQGTGTAGIELKISGKLVLGLHELSAQNFGKAPAQQRQIVAAAVFPISRNSSAQLVLSATLEGGVVTEVTSPTFDHSRVRFFHHECLVVTSSGFLTASASASCATPDFPVLYVGVTNVAKTEIIAFNQYFFKVQN